jgi:hypothetical protein
LAHFWGDREGDTPPTSSSVFCGRYQNHIKYAEFAAYCRSKGGTPTEKGFRTWLPKQKPQWRNRVKPPSKETGYVLRDKFFTKEEAVRLSVTDSDLILQFRPAVRRTGKVQIIEKP